MQGGCLCKAIKYSLEVDQILSLVCHCLDCQITTGSAFGTFAIVEKSGFELSGEPKKYTTKGDSGRTITRYFCGDCGSPIYSDLEKAPRMIVINAGTLEGGDKLIPQVHSWTKNKHDWVQLNEDAKVYEEEMP